MEFFFGAGHTTTSTTTTTTITTSTTSTTTDGTDGHPHQSTAFSLEAAAVAARGVAGQQQMQQAQQQHQQFILSQNNHHANGLGQQDQQAHESAFVEAAAALTSGHSSPLGPNDMNGPMLYTEPNRTSAIDDIRNGVLYIFIATIFLSFLLILPGIRNDKLATFLCVTTSLLVTSIILISLFGTSWHVGEATQMSAAYKAFSRDRIQGDLSVKIGLNSVNITLKAHKYFIIHQMEGPMVLMDAGMTGTGGGSPASRRASLLASLMPLAPVLVSENGIEAGGEIRPGKTDENEEIIHQNDSAMAAKFLATQTGPNQTNNVSSLADELVDGSNLDGSSEAESELESEEPFESARQAGEGDHWARRRDSRSLSRSKQGRGSKINTDPSSMNTSSSRERSKRDSNASGAKPKFTTKLVNHVDINYNERFYWIEPEQMSREYYHALKRGLPYPILTVVDYLSQDDAGFNWSRRYRLAGYYTSMLLWLATGVCVLMFALHCASPKHGIYTMQLLGLLLLSTNFTYFMLVPRGDKQLVISFEGRPLTFKFGWNFWLLLLGGCLALLMASAIVLVDLLFPNFIFTTVLDVDYDSHQDYYMKQKYLSSKMREQERARDQQLEDAQGLRSQPALQQRRPELPPFMMRKHSIVARR